MKGIKYYELVFENEEEGMCIIGTRKPSPEEASEFVKKDLDTLYESNKVIRVDELSKEQAEAFFDMENINRLPVFGDKSDLAMELTEKVLKRYDDAGIDSSRLNKRTVDTIYYSILGILDRETLGAAIDYTDNAVLLEEYKKAVSGKTEPRQL